MNPRRSFPTRRQFVQTAAAAAAFGAAVRCHLANIAYLVGRQIAWHGPTETIVGDDQAAGLLARPRRSGYELPRV